MPVDSGLDWSEVKDFTAGIWEVDDILMPSTAAQVMTDCFPLKQGGLRAWFKPTNFTTTGIGNTTNERVAGLFAHEGIINRSGIGSSTDFYLLTYDPTNGNTGKLYRLDGTNAAVSWSLSKTFNGQPTSNAPIVPISTANYIDSAGNRYACFAMQANNITDSGLWLVKYSDGTLNHLIANNTQMVANYQSRLIISGSVSASNPAVILFTDPALLTNIATNLAPVDPNEGIEWITGFGTFSPGDLIVFKQGAPIYLVEGDLNNYTVRQMNGSVFGGGGGVNSVVRGPQGLLFTAQGHLWITPDGSQVHNLSKQIKASSIGLGLAFYDHYVFTGNGGLIYDTDTGAFFRTSFVADNGTVPMRLVNNPGGGPGFMVADNVANGSPLQIVGYRAVDGETNHRCESYTWQSAPMRHPTGRQIEIRSVEVYAKSRNGATSTVTVTVNGVPQTLACDSSGRGGLSFYFLQRREELDVTVTAASNASGVEAPLIEVVRVGSRGGHFLRPVADAG